MNHLLTRCSAVGAAVAALALVAVAPAFAGTSAQSQSTVPVQGGKLRLQFTNSAMNTMGTYLGSAITAAGGARTRGTYQPPNPVAGSTPTEIEFPIRSGWLATRGPAAGSLRLGGNARFAEPGSCANQIARGSVYLSAGAGTLRFTTNNQPALRLIFTDLEGSQPVRRLSRRRINIGNVRAYLTPASAAWLNITASDCRVPGQTVFQAGAQFANLQITSFRRGRR